MRLTAYILFIVFALPLDAAQRPDSLSIRDSILSEARFLKSIYKTDEAFDLLNSIVQTEHFDEEVFSELADCQFQNGEYEKAHLLYMILNGKSPQKPLYKIRLMLSAYRMHDYKKAVMYGKEISETDTIPAILSLTGDSFNHIGEKDSALVYYRKSLGAKPQNESVTEKIARIYLDRKEYDNAIAVADSLLSNDKDNTTIAPVKGLALYLKEDYRSAIRIFERQDSIGNKSYGVLFHLGQSYWQMRQLLKAEKKLTEAWKVDSSDVNLAYSIACVKDILNRPYETEVMPWLDRTIEIMKPDILTLSRIYEQYGLCHFKQKHWAKALDYYRKAYEHNPKRLSYISTIAYCFEKVEDYKSALKWYEKYLKAAKPGSSGYEFVEQSINFIKGKLFMEDTVPA